MTQFIMNCAPKVNCMRTYSVIRQSDRCIKSSQGGEHAGCHLEIFFQEQSYSRLHSGQSIAWDPLRKKYWLLRDKISAKRAEFVIWVYNLWICLVNEEILKNVINIECDSQYPQMWWPVNVFQFPKMIVPNFLLHSKMHHLDMILFCSNMNRSFTALLHLVHHCALFTCNKLPSKSPIGILFLKQYFQIKINNLQCV